MNSNLTDIFSWQSNVWVVQHQHGFKRAHSECSNDAHLLKKMFYFICRSVFPVYSICTIRMQCLQMPEEGARSFGPGILPGHQHHVCWELSKDRAISLATMFSPHYKNWWDHFLLPVTCSVPTSKEANPPIWWGGGTVITWTAKHWKIKQNSMHGKGEGCSQARSHLEWQHLSLVYSSRDLTGPIKAHPMRNRAGKLPGWKKERCLSFRPGNPS